MIYIAAAKIVILAQPKTGSVALENALTARADWSIRRPNRMKHITYGQFRQRFVPMLEEFGGLSRGDYEVVGIMREPLDWFGSLFRFKSREELQGGARAHTYLGGMTFDDFIRSACNPAEAKLAPANTWLPCSVLLDTDNTIGVDRIYPYEDISALIDLIATRTEAPLTPKRVNVSPEREASLSEDVRALFNATYAPLLDLHASLRSDGVVDQRFRNVAIQPNWS